MQGEILLNLVAVLTPDDVRRMKAAGLADLAKKHIAGVDKLAAGWRRECGPIDSEVLAEVQIRVDELRAALRFDQGVKVYSIERGCHGS